MKTGKALICCALLAGCSGSGAPEKAAPVAAAPVHHGVLGKYCSECHVPPAPTMHAKDEWPSVVSRMDMHRMEARLPALTADEHKAVLAYLQSHAEK